MEILQEKFDNIRYFIGGRDNSIIIPGGKIQIAGITSDIITPGFATVDAIDEKEKCTIVTKGKNIIFELPDKIEFSYDPTVYRSNIIQSSIEYCIFEGSYGSKYVGCRYKCLLHKFGSPFISEFENDLICYYNGSYYRLPLPGYMAYDSRPEHITMYRQLDIKFEDMRYHVVLIINKREKTIRYTYSEKPIDTSSLNYNLVEWQTHTVTKTDKDIKNDIAISRDCYKSSCIFGDYTFKAFYRKA